MKTFKIYCVAALTITCCAAALAGSPDAAPASISDYSGYYGGVGIGMANGDFKLISRTTILPNNFQLDTFGKLAPEAFAVRLDLGYGRQLGQFYLGTYVDGQYHNLFRNAQLFADFPLVPPNPAPYNRHFFSAALRYTYGFGLKTGMLIAPRTLLFFKAGFAWANFKFKTIQDSFNVIANNFFFPITNSSHLNLAGGEFGIGLERRFSRHWSVAVQYLYGTFGSIMRNISEFGGGANRINTTKYRVGLSSAFAAVNYYFNPQDYDIADSAENAINSNYFNTIFVGLYGGLAYQTSSADLMIPTTGVSIFSSGIDHSKWSGLGGVEIGVGHTFNRFYLGMVAHGGLNYFRSTIYYRAFTLPALVREFVDVFKIRQYAGLAAKIGVLLSPKLLVYSKVGGVWGRFTVETYKSELEGGSDIFNGSMSKTEIGTQIGLGLEQYLGKHFSVHVEDVYSFYPVLRFMQSQTTPSEVPVSVIHNFRTDINVINAGFDYYFVT